jgi:geranylgeranyl diphosphate synthase type II
MQEIIAPYLQTVEGSLRSLSIPEKPENLYDPIRYFLGIGGKRIRPVFVLMSLELFRESNESDAVAALSTELFHNFSLIHDDMMDRADLRRGFQTVHKKWNEPTALLAGDALLVLAYEALLEAKPADFKNLLKRFNAMSLAVCEGQQWDMDFSEKELVSMDDYQAMIDRKTAALIGFAFELGGFLGHADQESRQTLYEFGLRMGRCFQLQDDFLDLFGEEAKTGKVRGGDIANGKLSYPVLVSLNHPNGIEFQKIWKERPLEDSQRVAKALMWMEQNGIPSLCKTRLETELKAGMQGLDSIPGKAEAREKIRNLCLQLAFREK